MDGQSIISAVVRRYRSVTSAKTNWFNKAWATELDEAKQVVSSDLEVIQKSIQKLQSTVGIFRSVSGPLKSPEILEYANRIDAIQKDLKRFADILRDILPLMDDLDKEWEDLMGKVAKDEKLRRRVIKEVERLPTYKKYHDLAERAGVIEERVSGIYESSDIEWTLEDYIGGEAGIHEDLEENYSGDPFGDMGGTVMLFGLLVLYSDEEVIDNHLDKLQD